jgi:formate dehydrogenase major subunit
MLNALAHVIVTEGLLTRLIDARGDPAFAAGASSSPAGQRPGATWPGVRRAGREIRAAARLYASGGNAAIYYGLGVTEHSQGSTAVMGIANLAMATGNIGREGVG